MAVAQSAGQAVADRSIIGNIETSLLVKRLMLLQSPAGQA